MATDRSPATFSGGGEILVFVDRVEGELDDAARGILGEGSKLARAVASPWTAAFFAPGAASGYEHFGGSLRWPRTSPRFAGGDQARDLAGFGAYGVPRVVQVETDREVTDLPEAQAEALARVAQERGAQVVLLAHNDVGVSLAPAVAARLGAALWTEVLAYAAGDDGLRLDRRALEGRAVETRVWEGGAPLVLTVDPAVMSAVVLPSVKPTRPSVDPVRVTVSEAASRTRVLERIPPDPQTVDVSEAEVIFCAGKGFDRETFELYRELARELNASLGVTRPVYDLGWTEFERMIGQTGKTVAPRFYLGMGISGSMHHVGGIRDSKRVVSLNVDPKAPMFPNSDEGFVADVRDVLPLLLERVRSHLPARASGGGGT